MWDNPIAILQLLAALAIAAIVGWIMYCFVRGELEHAVYIERRRVVDHLRQAADECCKISQIKGLPDRMRTRESFLSSALYDLADEIRDGRHR